MLFEYLLFGSEIATPKQTNAGRFGAAVIDSRGDLNQAPLITGELWTGICLGASIPSPAGNKQVYSPRYSLYGPKMHDELCPPKPKELDTAAVMSCFALLFGTTSMPSTSSMGSCTLAQQRQ